MGTYVVGIDTSSARLAVSMPTGHIAYEADPGPPDFRRFQLFRRAQHAFADLPTKSHIFCEEPLSLSRNGKTTRLLALAAGAIWAASVEFDHIWWWSDVANWKRLTIGKGNATKGHIAEWCRQDPAFPTEDLEEYLAFSDLFDAYAIRRAGELTLEQRV